MDHSNPLLYRRQFLLSPVLQNIFDRWKHCAVGPFHLYSHPDLDIHCEISDDGRYTVALLGYMLDPDNPGQATATIVKRIAQLGGDIDKIANHLRMAAGRFVMVVHSDDETLLFHDPCGLRTACYTRHEGQVYVASQPYLLKEVIPLAEGRRFQNYFNSAYVKGNKEHWIPAGSTLYENVAQLVPNHYLQMSSLRQVRYWPRQPIQPAPATQVVAQAAPLMQRLMAAAGQRFKLALPLTAGWDSRMLLAATPRTMRPDTYFYTLQYRDLDDRSHDVAIPRRLTESLQARHHLIDCRAPIDPAFGAVYQRNTPMQHLNDWGQIAHGMAAAYPRDRVCVKGNCSEIARCFYYKYGRHDKITHPAQIIELEKGWDELPFVRKQIENWFQEAIGPAREAHIDILDLFYWEQKMGGWQAQSQLEWDIVQEAYTPFNHRALLELLLATPAKLRAAPAYELYRMLIQAMSPELLQQPINPATAQEHVKNALNQLGLFDLVRGLVKPKPKAPIMVDDDSDWQTLHNR